MIARIHYRLRSCDGVQAIDFNKFLEDFGRDCTAMLPSAERPEQVVIEGIEVNLPRCQRDSMDSSSGSSPAAAHCGLMERSFRPQGRLPKSRRRIVNKPLRARKGLQQFFVVEHNLAAADAHTMVCQYR